MANIIINLKRIIRYGFLGFLRNGFVSLATVLVITISLFIIASSMYADAALKSVLSELKNQVDVNVYFVKDASEEDISAIKNELENLLEVDSITLVSAEEVLNRFKERHKNDQLSLQSIEELGFNPFGAVLAVRAKDPSQYEAISKFLTKRQKELQESGKDIIENVNYLDVKGAVDTLTSLIRASKKIALAVISFLIIVSILIVFNTIRLAVYTSKEEISVMKLVGASDWYVQGPFIIEGALYGILGGLFTIMILYPTSLWLSAPSKEFLVVFDTMEYFVNHFLQLSLMILGIGILLGVASSFLSVRRYLDI